MSTVATTRTLNTLFAERLAEAGVRRVYGFPGGGSNLDLMEAAASVGIRWILAHTETAAGLMACAEAEATGAPGVLLVGNGPGLASSVNAVAHAWLDRVPLIVISDRYTDAEAHTTGHQVLDQRALLEPVVKLSSKLEASTGLDTLEAAFATALAPKQGPVHLDLPRDQAVAAVPTGDNAQLDLQTGFVESQGAAAGLDPIAGVLSSARRPVILVGLEANTDVQPEALVQLARATSAAIFTTYKAKGIYPEHDARWAGIITGGEIERSLIESADVILSVGLDPVELLPRPWPYDATVLSLRTSVDLSDPTRPSQLWVGDLAIAIDALNTLAKQSPGDAGIPTNEISEYRNGVLAKLQFDLQDRLPSWRIVETISSALPSDSVVAVDAGALMLPATMFLRPQGPRRFSISSGLATMGYAIPAAIGAALARPGCTAVALTGDGGTAYGLSELETSVRTGLKVIVIVFNDASLSLIRIKHEANGYRRDPLDFGPIDFAAVASGFGAVGVTATNQEELESALGAALAREGTTLIDARITGNEYGETLRAIRG